MNIVANFLKQTALRFPDKIALVDGQVSFTYAQLHAAANRVAAGMASLGLKPDDRVAYHGNNRWELVVTMFAVIQGGYILIPLNVMLRPAELEYILSETGVSRRLAADDDNWKGSEVRTARDCGKDYCAAVAIAWRQADDKESSLIQSGLARNWFFNDEVDMSRGGSP